MKLNYSLMIMFPEWKRSEREEMKHLQQVVAKQRQDEGRPVSVFHEKENVLVNKVND